MLQHTAGWVPHQVMAHTEVHTPRRTPHHIVALVDTVGWEVMAEACTVAATVDIVQWATGACMVEWVVCQIRTTLKV